MNLLWLAGGLLAAGGAAPPEESTLGGVGRPAIAQGSGPSLMEPRFPKGRFSRVEIPEPGRPKPKPLGAMPMPAFGSALRETMQEEIASAQARLAQAEKNAALQHQYDQHHALLAAIEARALLDLVMERDAVLANEAAEAFMAWLMNN